MLRDKFKSLKAMMMILLVSLFTFTFTFSVPTISAASQLISSVDTTNKLVALTFDDGYDAGKIQEILSILSSNDVPGTFFMVGEAAALYPDLMNDIIWEGSQIANHSYTHPAFTNLTYYQMIEELNAADDIIQYYTGESTVPFFRAPYGDVNSSVLEAVGDAGYDYTIGWSIDTLDWQGLSADTIINTVVNNIHPGAIVLMHAMPGAANTPEALSYIISDLKNLGYDFVTISDLIGYEDSGYSAGYNAGHSAGYDDGYTNGYSNGYYEGYMEGYYAGYYDGYMDGYYGGYTDGYNDGYDDGYNAGYYNGYYDGYWYGYEEGYNDGYNQEYSPSYEEETPPTFVEEFDPAYEKETPPLFFGEENIPLFDEEFEAGFNDGYTDGYYEGNDDGYYDGYDDGFDAGYYNGYNDSFYEGYNEGYPEGYYFGYDEGTYAGYYRAYYDGYNAGYDNGNTDGYNDFELLFSSEFILEEEPVYSSGFDEAVEPVEETPEIQEEPAYVEAFDIDSSMTAD